MNKDNILQLIDYNYWANGLVIRTAENLTDQQFIQPSQSEGQSLREILVHTLFAEWIWRERMSGNSPNMEALTKVLQPEDFPNLKELSYAWFDEELKMREFLDKFPEDKFGQRFEYRTAAQNLAMEDTYLNVFHHLVLHGMQHRAEASTILTTLGHSPGNIDYIIYLREQG